MPTRKEEARDEEAEGYVGSPTIVVGVDGSAPSWDAFAWAAGEALRNNGRIIAVFVTSVIEPGEGLGSTGPLGYAAAVDAREEMAEQLADEVARRAQMLGVEVRFVRGTGDAPRALAEVARSEQADLMVVGRSAKLRHRLVGSVSRRLVLNHDGPVIVWCHEGSTEPADRRTRDTGRPDSRLPYCTRSMPPLTPRDRRDLSQCGHRSWTKTSREG